MLRETNQGSIWSALFGEHRSELMEIAEMLLCSNGSPEGDSQAALTELDCSPFYKAFGRVSAVRAVVKAAIALRICPAHPHWHRLLRPIERGAQERSVYRAIHQPIPTTGRRRSVAGTWTSMPVPTRNGLILSDG